MIVALLDKLTSRVTMYRLMLYVLIILAVIADILAVFDLVPGDPFAFQVSILILMAVCLLVNYLFAYMFGVRQSNISAFITAFILFFIYSPPESVAHMIILALVGAIAMATKYVLAWRGRHIFNPAAAAAVIAGFIGLPHASWWVGTGAMLVPVLLLGGLMLYKTRRLQMAAIFTSVSYVTTLAVYLIDGANIAQVLPVLVFSWPVWFLGGFMLSEPQTQPPRKWQRAVYAVVVGVLLGAQLQFGPVYIAPEIALVLGNIFAFMYGQRRGITLILTGRKQLSKDQVEYTFTSNYPLRYMAGQYMELQIPHERSDSRGQRHMFTIASAPGDREVRIGTRHYQPSSTFKKALQTLPINTQVSAIGIYGDFVLPNDPHEKILLIAGGIGVTPFRAQLEWLLKSGQSRDGILLYSVRSEDDAIFGDILQAKEHGIRTYIIPQPITREVLQRYVPDITKRHTYISGPPGMVDAVTQTAKQLGAPKVQRDLFNGY